MSLGTTFGIGVPANYSAIPVAPGFSAYASPSFGINPVAPLYSQPYPIQSIGGFGIGATQPLQQIQQLLQIVPQQLQQVQALQQQQLLHLQQLLQLVPAQLQQLQQLIQIVPQQVQHLQQQWHPFAAGTSGPLGFGLTPQVFSGPAASHVM